MYVLVLALGRSELFGFLLPREKTVLGTITAESKITRKKIFPKKKRNYTIPIKLKTYDSRRLFHVCAENYKILIDIYKT